MTEITRLIMRDFLFAGVLLTMITVAPLFGQVEHNYQVGPQTTNCDSLDIASFSVDDAISVIKLSSFRFQQEFKISRTYGIMSASYFSCDGRSGYLIIKVDKNDSIYLDVPQSKWTGFISSSDINRFYDEEIRGNYKVIGKKDD